MGFWDSEAKREAVATACEEAGLVGGIVLIGLSLILVLGAVMGV